MAALHRAGRGGKDAVGIAVKHGDGTGSEGRIEGKNQHTVFMPELGERSMAQRNGRFRIAAVDAAGRRGHQHRHGGDEPRRSR